MSGSGGYYVHGRGAGVGVDYRGEYGRKPAPEHYPLCQRDCACVDDPPHTARRPDLRNGDRPGVYGVPRQESPPPPPAPQQVVVIANNRGASARALARPRHDTAATPAPANATSASGCCRSAALLLLLTIFALAFLLVSGFLFYFNKVCDEVECAHGGVCTEGAGGRPVCRCPVDCPPVRSPVCGTDGATYANVCALRLYSCTHKKHVLIQHPGECVSRDPCEGRACPAGARCVPSADGRAARCLCPPQCPLAAGRSSDPPTPVCGTDNRDYADHCQLHRRACETQLPIAIKYEGLCDPCAGVECVAPEVCQLDDERRPSCRCGAERCPPADATDPVCGSDGLTYASECFLRLQACRLKTSIRIVFRGSCSLGLNLCKGVDCVFGEVCAISKFGIAQCECPRQCEPIVRHACGSDGRTYDSQCHLHKAACLDRIHVTVAFNGPCNATESCKDVACSHGGECVLRGGEPRCRCPSCPLHYSPLCGSDGHSYRNACELRAAGCQLSTNIDAVHLGVCNGCETKTCGYFATCELDHQGVAQCVCMQNCSSNETPEPVCGTDGVTYKSLCELRKFVCESKLPIELDYDGGCDLCQDVECSYGAKCQAGECVCPTSCPGNLEEPVCASNMETYKSECEMQRQACAGGQPPAKLTVIFYGACSIKMKALHQINSSVTTESTAVGTVGPPRDPCRDIQCEFGASCELGPDGHPRCSCLLDCSHENIIHICGSDFRMYNSTCAMKTEACQRQKEIRLRPLELCKGMQVKPCNGESAVADPETGEELDCGSGPRRQDCPLHSYCHQTPNFAKCCPKEAGVYLKSCQDSWYGCCPDKKTPAQGPQHAGCPSLCGCNKIGSYSEACVGESDQCQCRPGVGGLKCDRCLPGYWGLPKITSGYQGCLACECSERGSVREDCEQMTGRCVCKPGVQGHKCGECANPRLTLTAQGCTNEVESTPSSMCDTISCSFRATCEETKDGPQCICTLSCPEDDSQEVVCGDDRKLYASKCQLKLFVCQVQKHIGVKDMAYCADDGLSMTDLPIKQWTLDYPYTEIEEVGALFGARRSARHSIRPKHALRSVLRRFFAFKKYPVDMENR